MSEEYSFDKCRYPVLMCITHNHCIECGDPVKRSETIKVKNWYGAEKKLAVCETCKPLLAKMEVEAVNV